MADGQKEWATYAPMKARLQAQEARRIAAAEPRPIPLVEVTEAELETALAGLSFPEFDAPVVSILVPVFNNLRLPPSACSRSGATRTAQSPTR